MLVIVATVITVALTAGVILVATQSAAWLAVYGPCGRLGAAPDCRTTQWTGAATGVLVVGPLLLAGGWVLTALGHRWWAVLATSLAIACPLLAAAVGSVLT